MCGKRVIEKQTIHSSVRVTYYVRSGLNWFALKSLLFLLQSIPLIRESVDARFYVRILKHRSSYEIQL